MPAALSSQPATAAAGSRHVSSAGMTRPHPPTCWTLADKPSPWPCSRPCCSTAMSTACLPACSCTSCCCAGVSASPRARLAAPACSSAWSGPAASGAKTCSGPGAGSPAAGLPACTGSTGCCSADSSGGGADSSHSRSPWHTPSSRSGVSAVPSSGSCTCGRAPCASCRRDTVGAQRQQCRRRRQCPPGCSRS